MAVRDKEKERTRGREYRARNVEKEKKRHREYYLKNKERVRENERKRQKEHPRKRTEAQKAQRREQYRENPDKERMRSREWAAKHREKTRFWASRYVKNNPDKIKIARHDYHKRHPEVTRESWRRSKARRLEFVNSIKRDLRCSMCGESFRDHPSVIDFHHVGTEPKSEGIAIMLGRVRSEKAILAEIAKCMALCANCHRILHDKKRKHIPI